MPSPRRRSPRHHKRLLVHPTYEKKRLKAFHQKMSFVLARTTSGSPVSDFESCVIFYIEAFPYSYLIHSFIIIPLFINFSSQRPDPKSMLMWGHNHIIHRILLTSMAIWVWSTLLMLNIRFMMDPPHQPISCWVVQDPIIRLHPMIQVWQYRFLLGFGYVVIFFGHAPLI